mmetsp:Transcript_27237/g.63478  ORF Transcript_27237/g.63478 Transcript_27237/m.63478 type:complete len:86 (-) Transcript_27237:2180-2437(-)
MPPPFTTQILLLFFTVLRRCAMMITVICPEAIIESMACCTCFSDSVSSALVASSKRSTLGLRTSALAIAIRCFWPPDSCTPRSPT